jgi:MFS family permease
LFIGRIIDGLAAGNFPIAQSVISDISKSKEERTTSLGYIGAIFGVGFLIGPFLGGVLSTVSTAFPFYFVGILSTLNFCAAYFLLPETHHGRNADHPVSLNPFTPVLQAFKKGTLRPLYVTWFMFNAIAMGSNAIFALYLAHVYGFSAYTVGLFFTAVGLIIAFNQGFALKRIWLKYFTEKQLIVYLMAAFGIGFLFMAYSALWAFIIGLVLTSFGQSVLRVAINSEVLGEASPTEKGLASGVLSAVASIASVVGPLVIGYVYEFHVSWSYILVGVLSLATMYYIQRRQFPHIEVPIQ